MVEPDTTLPTSFERAVARRAQKIMQSLRLDSPYCLNAPAKPTIGSFSPSFQLTRTHTNVRIVIESTDPFEFSRNADAVEDVKGEDDEVARPGVSLKYSIADLQLHKNYRVIDQTVVPVVEGESVEPLAPDNADANKFPHFFESVYPSPESLANIKHEKSKKEIKSEMRNSNKRNAETILSGSEVSQIYPCSASMF